MKNRQVLRVIIQTEVIIENEKIVGVKVIKHQDDNKWFNRAYGALPNEIIMTQSTNVDVVSSATYSSKGIINSVKNALGRKDFLRK